MEPMNHLFYHTPMMNRVKVEEESDAQSVVKSICIPVTAGIKLRQPSIERQPG